MVSKTYPRIHGLSTLVNVATKKLHGAYTLTPARGCKVCGLTFAADGFEVFDQIADRIFGEEHFLRTPHDARRFQYFR